MCTTCGCGASSQKEQEKDKQKTTRLLEVETDLLQRNEQHAKRNHQQFTSHNILALNLVSSPGSGKTTLLVKTIEALQAKSKVAVIEGDQQTRNDADRIQETGAPAIQINTGKGCHLDAHGIGHALEQLDLSQLDYLMIENVGNLVCPAAFNLGEFAKVVVLSVTEGEDKPLKYPDMFKAASVMILNKTDLLPYLDFDLDQTIAYAKQVNPDIKIFELSSKSGEGMDKWLGWLESSRKTLLSATDSVTADQATSA